MAEWANVSTQILVELLRRSKVQTKGRHDYRRRRFVIVSLTMPCLTPERHGQEELANH